MRAYSLRLIFVGIIGFKSKLHCVHWWVEVTISIKWLFLYDWNYLAQILDLNMSFFSSQRYLIEKKQPWNYIWSTLGKGPAFSKRQLTESLSCGQSLPFHLGFKVMNHISCKTDQKPRWILFLGLRWGIYIIFFLWWFRIMPIMPVFWHNDGCVTVIFHHPQAPWLWVSSLIYIHSSIHACHKQQSSFCKNTVTKKLNQTGQIYCSKKRIGQLSVYIHAFVLTCILTYPDLCISVEHDTQNAKREQIVVAFGKKPAKVTEQSDCFSGMFFQDGVSRRFLDWAYRLWLEKEK